MVMIKKEQNLVSVPGSGYGETRTGYGRKRGRTFWITWAVIAAVIAVIWTVVLIVMTNALREYESVQPQYYAEEVFHKYFAPEDAVGGTPPSAEELSRRLEGVEVPCVSKYENDEVMLNYIAGTLSSEDLKYSEGISSNENLKSYIVTAGETKVGSFTLVQGGKPTKMLGLYGWVPETVVISLQPVRGVSVYAPKHAVVTVNGVELTSNEIVGDEVVIEDAEYFPDDDEDVRVMVNYYVEGLFCAPEVSVRAPGINGTVYTTQYDTENEAYDAEYGYRLALADEYNRAIERENQLREEEERRKQEEEERRRQEEEERLRKEEEERQRISDEIKAVYGDFVIEANQKFCVYSHTKPADRSAMRASVLSYFKRGTKLYSNISSYYDYASWYPTEIKFEDVNADKFEWLDEEKKTFKCHLTMKTTMTGKTETSDGYRIDTITETYSKVVYVEVSGAKNLIYDLENSSLSS